MPCMHTYHVGSCSGWESETISFQEPSRVCRILVYLNCRVQWIVRFKLFLTLFFFPSVRPGGFFDGVFLAKDAEVSSFVDYIHGTTKHVMSIFISEFYSQFFCICINAFWIPHTNPMFNIHYGPKQRLCYQYQVKF